MTTVSKPPAARSRHRNQWPNALDPLLDAAIQQGICSAAALLVGRGGQVVFETIRGRCYEHGPALSRTARFDLASLTKPLATASIVIRQTSRGRLNPDDRLGQFFPAGLLKGGKKDIHLRHLLNHSSGLPAYRPYFRDLVRIEPKHRRATLGRWILSEPLAQAPGRKSCYSDLGFILLGMILEDAFGSDLDNLFRRTLADCPGAAAELGYLPLITSTDPEIPPMKTEFRRGDRVATENCPWRKRLLVGEVHDENAYCLNGTAGHAGLFGTTRGIWTWLDFLCSIYRKITRHPHWDAAILHRFWSRSESPPDSTWALGFDTPSPEGSSAGRYFSPGSIGHLGFTGTSFWLDPEREICIILLTNRVHPNRDNNRMKAFRPLLHDTVMRVIHET